MRAVLLGMMVLMAGAVQANEAFPRALKIATEGARPPYNFLDATNAPAGLEIDLGNALCVRMNGAVRVHHAGLGQSAAGA